MLGFLRSFVAGWRVVIFVFAVGLALALVTYVALGIRWPGLTLVWVLAAATFLSHVLGGKHA